MDLERVLGLYKIYTTVSTTGYKYRLYEAYPNALSLINTLGKHGTNKIQYKKGETLMVFQWVFFCLYFYKKKIKSHKNKNIKIKNMKKIEVEDLQEGDFSIIEYRDEMLERRLILVKVCKANCIEEISESSTERINANNIQYGFVLRTFLIKRKIIKSKKIGWSIKNTNKKPLYISNIWLVETETIKIMFQKKAQENKEQMKKQKKDNNDFNKITKKLKIPKK